MSFLRHDEIYRPDVGIKTILSLGPCAASRWSAPSQHKGRGFHPAPFPSSAMSLGSPIPWRVALQQSPPPLHPPESMVYPLAETVNHHLTRAGEFSTGVDIITVDLAPRQLPAKAQFVPAFHPPGAGCALEELLRPVNRDAARRPQ